VPLLIFYKVMDSDWTLAHGFYTLMGGFVIDLGRSYDPKDPEFTNGIERLTLTPRGLLLLAKCGHLPKISEEEIMDKSKVDELGKLLACTQVTWMVVQVCTRLGLRLPVTLLEVTAVSHVVCALVLYALWWHKPRKVDEPTVLTGDWVRSLAAFMLMCSHESEGQILPGFHLKGEHSEIAGLKLLPGDAAIHVGSPQTGRFTFALKHEATLYAGAVRVRIPQPSEDLSLENVDSENDKNGIFITTKTRWDLALAAVQTYPAVRELLRFPPHGYNHRYETALATYPEMPLKCRRKLQVEDVDLAEDPWLEPQLQATGRTMVFSGPLVACGSVRVCGLSVSCTVAFISLLGMPRSRVNLKHGSGGPLRCTWPSLGCYGLEYTFWRSFRQGCGGLGMI
jgi:hypothetical protein